MALKRRAVLDSESVSPVQLKLSRGGDWSMPDYTREAALLIAYCHYHAVFLGKKKK